MLQPGEGSGARAHPHGDGEGWQWSLFVHHALKSGAPLVDFVPGAGFLYEWWSAFHSMIPVIVAVLTLSLFFAHSSCSWYAWSYVTSPWTTLDIIQ